MRFKCTWIVGMFLLLLSFSLVFAQADCPQIVKEALTTATNACINTARNDACYGNVRLDVQTRVAGIAFENKGDTVALEQISSLKLSSYNEPNREWGIAIMKLQANLPDTLPGQNVTVLLFGNVELADATQPGTKPMSAFYFKTGIGDAPCEEAPDSGILIQTPKGVGQVTLSINEVVISLGSTAFLQAQPGDVMSISMLGGAATFASQTITAGSKAEIPITDVLSPSGSVSEPVPYDFSVISRLPTTYLDSLASGVALIETVCTVSPKNSQTILRVGPGTNRGSIVFMPQGSFVVTGRVQLDDNSIWFQLNKDEVVPEKQVLEVWVNSNDVNQNGSCDNVSAVATPRIVQSVPRATVAAPNNAPQQQAPNVVSPSDNIQAQPIIEFSADTYDIVSFGCAILHWHVENIQEVYLDGASVTGPFGQHEVCISSTTTFTLRVVLKTGGEVNNQITIHVS